ncbi:unnamed protein product, partial [marine sediment metagenome]
SSDSLGDSKFSSMKVDFKSLTETPINLIFFLFRSKFLSRRTEDENLAEAIDKISDKFGEDKLTIARLADKYEILD